MGLHSTLGSFRAVFIAAAFVVLALPAGPARAEAGVDRQIVVDACPASFPANWRCLRVRVPDDYGSPTGRWTWVRAVVAPAFQPKPAPEAVFLIQGGPGVSGTAVAGAGFINSIAAMQASDDLVVVDERDVSGPEALICPPTGPTDELATWGEDVFSPRHLATCLARSESQADLKSLTTTTFARDMETVRDALGYQTLEFYTGNYGGRIVQEYLRLFPGRTRAAVLADVGPMDEPPAWRGGPQTLRAIEATIAACAADDQCRGAYPDLQAQFTALMAKLSDAPLAAAVVRGGRRQTVSFDRSTVISFFGSHFHFMRDVAAIPYEIAALASGEPARVGAVAGDIADYQRSVYGGLALGVWMSVTCAEDAAPMRARLAAGERPGSERVAALLQACAAWPHGTPPADFHEPVRTEVPILLLASPFEPSYPAELAPRAAARFSAFRIVVDANHGHVFDDDWQMCLGAQATSFLDSGDLAAVDPRCAAKFTFRPFKLPDGVAARA